MPRPGSPRSSSAPRRTAAASITSSRARRRCSPRCSTSTSRRCGRSCSTRSTQAPAIPSIASLRSSTSTGRSCWRPVSATPARSDASRSRSSRRWSESTRASLRTSPAGPPRILENLEAARARFPPRCDLRRLSVFVLTVMEGAVMQARSFKSIAPFDDSVRELREYLELLQRQPRSRRPRKHR